HTRVSRDWSSDVCSSDLWWTCRWRRRASLRAGCVWSTEQPPEDLRSSPMGEGDEDRSGAGGVATGAATSLRRFLEMSIDLLAVLDLRATILEVSASWQRSEEHTSELQSREN